VSRLRPLACVGRASERAPQGVVHVGGGFCWVLPPSLSLRGAHMPRRLTAFGWERGPSCRISWVRLQSLFGADRAPQGVVVLLGFVGFAFVRWECSVGGGD
jgi:hypothetical protein